MYILAFLELLLSPGIEEKRGGLIQGTHEQQTLEKHAERKNLVQCTTSLEAKGIVLDLENAQGRSVLSEIFLEGDFRPSNQSS